MTEIKIEKKKPILPWLLLLLGVIAATWYFFFKKDNVEPVKTEIVESSALIDVRENNNIVADYVTFINSDTNKMSLDHAYSSEAINKLTNAVEAMANEVGYDVKVDIDKAKQYAEEITKDPMVTNHADKIRISADLLSTSLQNMQQSKFPSLSAEVTEVKSAASAIDPEILTLDQKDAVKSFFKKTADLLNKMN